MGFRHFPAAGGSLVSPETTACVVPEPALLAHAGISATNAGKRRPAVKSIAGRVAAP